MKMSSFSFTGSVGLLLMLAWGGAGYWAGDYNRNNAWLAKQTIAERKAKEQLQAAQARGDTLSSELLQQQDQITQLKTEKLHAISQVTTGRTCLNGATLRLLDKAPGLSVSGLPAATSSPTAADERVATDTDIALWVTEAAAQFEVCRTRLDALIGWHAP